MTGSSLRNRSHPNRLRNHSRRNRILCSHSRDLRHSRDIHRRRDTHRSRRSRALPA
jgi:hypothetical protein